MCELFFFSISFSFTRPRLRHSRGKPENPGLSFLMQHVSAALGPSSSGWNMLTFYWCERTEIIGLVSFQTHLSSQALPGNGLSSVSADNPYFYVSKLIYYCRIYHLFYKSGLFSHFEQQKDETWKQIHASLKQWVMTEGREGTAWIVNAPSLYTHWRDYSVETDRKYANPHWTSNRWEISNGFIASLKLGQSLSNTSPIKSLNNDFV